MRQLGLPLKNEMHDEREYSPALEGGLNFLQMLEQRRYLINAQLGRGEHCAERTQSWKRGTKREMKVNKATHSREENTNTSDAAQNLILVVF